jgi:hypothetical protein
MYIFKIFTHKNILRFIWLDTYSQITKNLLKKANHF